MPQADPPKTPGGDEPAHDVLAAEAFAVPAPDPSLRHGPVVLPEDPSGIIEPHDILAAEEFAIPAPKGKAGSGASVLSGGRRSAWQAAIGAIAALVGIVTLRRRRG